MGGQRFWRYMLIWALLVGTIWFGDRFVRGVFLTADEPRAVTPRGSLSEAEQSTISLFDSTAPSVVYIFTDRAVSPGDVSGRGTQGAGSGFIWDAAGHVVTNHHVVEGAAREWRPNPLFDAGYYVRQYPDVATSGMLPLVHFTLRGDKEGRRPNPLFYTSFYNDRNPDVWRRFGYPTLAWLGLHPAVLQSGSAHG